MRPRNVLVMLVIAVIAVLAYLALRSGPVTPGGGLPATLPAFAKNEVTKISAMNKGRPLVLRRRADKSDAWEVEVETTTVRADALAIDDLLSELSRQNVIRKFDYVKDKLTDKDIKDYGLDAPSTTIELTCTGDKKLLVRYGKRTREGGGSYVDTGPKTDVWIVGGTVEETLLSGAAAGYRSNKLTDMRLYDIGKVELVRGGVTILEAERDTTQIWRVRQPFKGFADPEAFERLLAKLAGTEVTKWVEINSKNLKDHGLDPPFGEVRLTHKTTGETSVVLLGSAAEGDLGVHVMEKGTPNVALSPKRLLDALVEIEKDPGSIRDHSFTRIGIDGVAIGVKLGKVAYELRKEGASWDVTKPDRSPGDDQVIRDAMEKIRSWKTVEFADAAKPEEKGITDAGDSIQVELAGNQRTTLLIGTQADATSWWAQRKSPEGDSGVERVDGAVIELFAQDYPQFKKKQVRDFSSFMGELQSIAREQGKSDEGVKVQSVVVEQDSAKNVAWHLSANQGPGLTGTLDTVALQKVLEKLRVINTKRWLFWSPEKDAEMGFHPPFADTLTMTVKFGTASAAPPGGEEQILLVGKKAPGGGWYARFGDAAVGDKSGWAFVLSEADVEDLKTPLVK